MAVKAVTSGSVVYGQRAPFITVDAAIADVDDGDTTPVPGLARIHHVEARVTGATEEFVAAASTSGNVITWEGGTNSPVQFTAYGYR